MPGTLMLYMKIGTCSSSVRVFFRKCNGRAACNCAVAVRSGDDVILIDRCGPDSDNAQPHLDVRSYINDDLTLGTRVVKYEGGKEYRVYLPTGSYIVVKDGQLKRDRQGYLNVFMHASALDFNQTVGLCGTFNGDKEDDLTLPDGTVDPSDARKPDSFSLQWRVSEEDSLFTGYCPGAEEDESVEMDDMSCSCLKGKNITCDSRLFYQCEVDPVPGEDITASIPNFPLRRCFSIQPWIVFQYNASYIATAGTFPTPGGINQTEAYRICSEYIFSAEVGVLCNGFISAKIEVSIQSCVEDIAITDDISWAFEALSSVKVQCLAEIATNTDLWIVDGGGLVPPFNTTHLLCPECENDGVCLEGKYLVCKVDTVPPFNTTHLLCPECENDGVCLEGKYLVCKVDTVPPFNTILCPECENGSVCMEGKYLVCKVECCPSIQHHTLSRV
ncbi:uncharacterized protein LOC117339038 [Pecten maximus]|uniref:uncharacterized protein LOC117339038 n=1 Tax=Pecten maximus TaxID=6579 RepID=UPI001458F9CD|nr:uncharacterized protein LOC117339038 [Pecten maximus]